MHHQNLEQLKALRLFGMARALEELAHTRERDALSFDDQLAVVIEREAADRVCALGNQAAREGHAVLYTRLNRLLDDLAVARVEGGANRLLRKLAKVSVLILDDFAMTELTAAQRRDLMEVIDDRHERGATVIATQIHAILDRLVHQAHRIELTGESLRKTRAGGESVRAASSGAAE